MDNSEQAPLPDVGILEKEIDETYVAPPPWYHVIINNDDYTPMDFVVEVLMHYFYLDPDKATQLMLQVHHQGKAIGGTYTAEIAETKVVQVMQYAKEHGHPLLCTMETV